MHLHTIVNATGLWQCAAGADRHGGNYALGYLERRTNRVDRIKKWFLVLLQVLVVRRRQTLERHQESSHLGRQARCIRQRCQ